jgi:hypothetical protein
MDMMPERTISATYAPELTPNEMIAAAIMFCEEPKMMKYMIRSCTVLGVPRITVRYSLHSRLPRPSRMPPTPCQRRRCESYAERTTAIMIPMITPRISAPIVILNVVPRPLRK